MKKTYIGLERNPRLSLRTGAIFGAANYKALVCVNGKKVGEHGGGFTPFAFDVSKHLKQGCNSIVVGVDSTHDNNSLPTPITDWKNYGGLTRPVHLISLSRTP